MKISPEAAFLTLSCRDASVVSDHDLTEYAKSVSDWDKAVSISATHGILPQVMRVVSDLMRAGIVPEWIMSPLRNLTHTDVAMQARLRIALKEMLPVIRKNGAEVIVLKGPAIAELLYETPGERTYRDLDLLCREEDYGKLWHALTSLGYRTDEGPTLPARKAEQETYFERKFLHPDGLVRVDVHPDAMKLGVRPRHAEDLWKRAVPTMLEGEPTWVLCPEDQLLTLCVHLHRHGFIRLIWFKDIDLLLRRYGDRLDWDMIKADAKAEGSESSIWYTLKLTRKLLGTPLAPDIEERFKPNPLIRLAYHLIWPESDALNLRSTTRRRAVQFSVSESWRGMLPSLLLMGRKREKMEIILRRVRPF
ncbi:MAG: nucleotidyltransferase family protein [Chloroflexi bacterium]|nr:nucleotidyltransferase family protein [Chloroflexota bacterium]